MEEFNSIALLVVEKFISLGDSYADSHQTEDESSNLSSSSLLSLSSTALDFITLRSWTEILRRFKICLASVSMECAVCFEFYVLDSNKSVLQFDECNDILAVLSLTCDISVW